MKTGSQNTFRKAPLLLEVSPKTSKSEFLGGTYYKSRILSGPLPRKGSLSSADPCTALQRPPEEGAWWGGGNNCSAIQRGWVLGTGFPAPPLSLPQVPRPQAQPGSSRVVRF